MEWIIKPGYVAIRLGLVMLVLVAINTGALICAFAFEFACPGFLLQVFFVDAEANLPALYSSVLLLLVSLLCWFAGRAVAAAAKNGTRYWYGLAWIFVFLAADEAAALHEKLSDPLRELLSTSGALTLAWVIPYGFIVLLLGVLYSQFVFRLPAKTRIRVIVAGVLYVGGALGFELLGSQWASVHGAGNGVWVGLATVEELLEMSGLIVMIYALLGYLNELYTTPSIRFAGDVRVSEDDWRSRI